MTQPPLNVRAARSKSVSLNASPRRMRLALGASDSAS